MDYPEQWHDLGGDDVAFLDADDFEGWIASGLRTIEIYLERHAAFDAWCDDQRRRYGSRPGDRA